MHICFVCREYPPSLRGGGIASYIKEVAHGLCDAGHRVTVIAASDDTRVSSDEDDDGVRVIRLSGGDFVIPQVEGRSIVKKFRMFYRFYPYRKKIRRKVFELKDVDIIEVPEYGAEGYFLDDIGIPVVTRLHTPMLLDHNNFSLQRLSKENASYYWQGRKELEVMKKARYITSCSTSLKDWSCKFLHIPHDRIKVIYNPILAKKWTSDSSGISLQSANSKSFSSQGNRLLSPSKMGENHILFVGTVCDWKGCGDLADACKLLLDFSDMSDFHLDLVGKTGAFADALQAKYGDEPWFHLIGKLPREEVMKRYAEADVVCFPSWWENMPMVCIEAMLSGAVVIGSNSGGMSEIIEDGKSGFLLSPKNPKAWAEKIKEACALSEEQKNEMRKKAHERIMHCFDMDVIIPQMVDYYQYVIDNHNQQTR
mgnify:CR=1 FL=1